MASKRKEPEAGPVLAANRAASHEYHLLQRLEAGLVLTGSEVKSARAGQVSIKEAYARVERNEVFLYQAHFNPYDPAAHDNHDPLRRRKLLLHAREIRKLARETESAGTTLIPTKLYLKDGRIKLELAVARGKKAHDKRDATRTREAKREMDRARGDRQTR